MFSSVTMQQHLTSYMSLTEDCTYSDPRISSTKSWIPSTCISVPKWRKVKPKNKRILKALSFLVFPDARMNAKALLNLNWPSAGSSILRGPSYPGSPVPPFYVRGCQSSRSLPFSSIT